jgi:hypothetical protein
MVSARQRCRRRRSSAARRQAGVLTLDAEAQIARRLVQAASRLLQRRIVLAGGDRLVAGVAGQFDDLCRAHALSEEHAGDLGQLVGFVEDHRVAGRQQFAHALVLQHHVGEEQVVINHHHVRHQGLAPGIQDEAVLDLGALLAETVIAGRGGQHPGAGILGHAGQFGLVAALGGLGELGDGAQVAGLGLAVEGTAVRQGAFQVVGTDVVGPPLQQSDAGTHRQGVADRRQVAVKQLVLQGLGTGGDDHLAAAQQGWDKIGEGLAGTGAGFGDEDLVARHRRGDPLGHLLLLFARPIAGDEARQGAVGSENAGEFGHWDGKPPKGRKLLKLRAGTMCSR